MYIGVHAFSVNCMR